MISILTTLLIYTLSAEAPTIIDAPKFEKFREGVSDLVDINTKVAEDGKLVNEDVDTELLSTIELFEGRLRIKPKDGDCSTRYVKSGNKTIEHRYCNAVGPMQLSKQMVTWLPKTMSGWDDINVDSLRDPETNIRAGYDTLLFWKNTCKSNIPGVWITAYGSGHCPKNNRLDFEGTRRCGVLTAMLKGTNKMPNNWKCGDEGHLTKDKAALRFIEKLKENG